MKIHPPSTVICQVIRYPIGVGNPEIEHHLIPHASFESTGGLLLSVGPVYFNDLIDPVRFKFSIYARYGEYGQIPESNYFYPRNHSTGYFSELERIFEEMGIYQYNLSASEISEIYAAIKLYVQLNSL